MPITKNSLNALKKSQTKKTPMQKPARSDPGGRFLYTLSSVPLEYREEKASLFVLDDGEEFPELILCVDLVASGLWRMDLRLADDVWVEVHKAVRGMQFLAAEDPILNSEAASQKRKRADAKKTKK